MILKIVAEFLGTLGFTFFGSLITGPGWAVALGNGMALTLAVAMTAKISGGHINPAVSLAAGIGATDQGIAPWVQTASFMGAQFLGAMLGFGLTLPLSIKNEEPCPKAEIDPSTLLTVFYEAVCTMVLLAAVFVPLTHQGLFRPSIIGATAAVAIMGLHDICGVVMNPARLLAPTVRFSCPWPSVLSLLIGEAVAACSMGILLFVAGKTNSHREEPEGIVLNVLEERRE